MKSSFLFLAAVLSIGAPSAHGQCGPGVTCPGEVVQQYIRWDMGGSLLTWANDKPAFNQDARRMFSDLFQHYNEPTQPPAVIVIYDYWVETYAIQGDKAEIRFAFYPLGDIDSSMRWRPPGQEFMSYVLFHLVLSNKRWETGTDGRETVYNVNPAQWLINDGPGVMHFIKLESAISYAQKVRAKVTNPAVHKNADATLAILEKLRRRKNVAAP